MNIEYFADTDTLYIELSDQVAESRDWDGNTLLHLDASGSIVALTIEHASTRTDCSRIAIEGIPFQRPVNRLHNFTDKEARSVLKTALRITALWGLTDKQTRILLGSPAPATFQAWKAGAGPPPMDEETRLRAGHLLGIYANLQVLYPENQELVEAWPTQPDEAEPLKGRRALDVMLESLEGLELVRRYTEYLIDQ